MVPPLCVAADRTIRSQATYESPAPRSAATRPHSTGTFDPYGAFRWEPGSAIAFAAGIWPRCLATLEVPERRSGSIISFPVVIADLDGERFLVAMVGERTNWM